MARVVRRFDPGIKMVAGGYHPSLMARDLPEEDLRLLDFIVRGEGEATLGELVAELEQAQPDFSRVAGLSYRQGAHWEHNAPRPLLDLDQLLLPRRESRVNEDFFFLDMPMIPATFLAQPG